MNLIGEHTDYNDGLALPFAIQAGVSVSARAHGDAQMEVNAVELGEHDRFRVDDPRPIHGWRAFARGVVAELTAIGMTPPAATIAITSDLPRAAGLSSSAALTVALTMALARLASAEPLAPIELARLCQRVENDWVGAHTGLLDQLASISGSERHASLIDFQELTIEPIPLELADHQLVLLASGEDHDNATSGYNQRRAECTEAAHRMGAASLRDAFIQDLHMLPDRLVGRARHVISENGRVLQTVEALRRGDLEAVGRLLNISHASLRDDFEVSTPAIEAAVRTLRDAGALGARLVGGGFGGNVLGLMPPGAVAPAGATIVTPSAGARFSD